MQLVQTPGASTAIALVYIISQINGAWTSCKASLQIRKDQYCISNLVLHQQSDGKVISVRKQITLIRGVSFFAHLRFEYKIIADLWGLSVTEKNLQRLQPLKELSIKMKKQSC